MYTEQYQRRMQDEHGVEHAFVVGYAQDHEGYLLIPEDWLVGGYEPNINIWGPLQGEHIMEGNLDIVSTHLSTLRLEPQDGMGEFPDTVYPERPLPTIPPDSPGDVGQILDSIPEDLYVPLAITPQTEPDASLSRVQGIAQLVWAGGDPAVDLPEVVLERLSVDTGEWAPVLTQAGRTISDTGPDILTAYTPDPLYPWEAAQSHYWWAGWQAVGHVVDRTSLPEGEYRLHVYGQTYDGGSASWPWSTTEYEVFSEPFTVTPAHITVVAAEGQVSASIDAPVGGYRLIDIDGSSVGANPVRGGSLSWETGDGFIDDAAEGIVADGITTFSTTPPEGAIRAIVTDGHGNSGTIELP
jgi:neutral ceramidase